MARPRAIVVDGSPYRWVVRRSSVDWPGFATLVVWRPRSGRPLHVRLRWDDPWLNYGPMLTTPPERFDEVWANEPITPSRVADQVRAALAAGWDPDERGAPFALVTAPDSGDPRRTG